MQRASLGIGVIGAGRHGLRYAHHLREGLPGLHLAGMARRDPDRIEALAGELRCFVSADYRELLAHASVDAVAVVVPPALHGEILDAAASAGKPVLLEKPAAISVSQGRQMLRRVRESGIPVMVAQTLRYNETVASIRRAEERVGRIHSLRVSLRFEPLGLSWLLDPALAGGGVMLHTGIHAFDLVRFLGGLEADRVQAEIAHVRGDLVEDNFSAILQLGDGRTLATVSGCRATAARSGAIEIAGDRGQLVADHVLRNASLLTERGAEVLPIGPPVSTVALVLEDFSRVARGIGPNPIPLEEGLRAVALVEAAYDSARTGRVTPVASVEA